MTRRKMIEILIEDRLTEWVFAGNYDGLEEFLWDGWKGYGEYTDKELKKELERFEKDDIEKLLGQIEWRKEEDRKREEDEKKGIYKDPFE